MKAIYTVIWGEGYEQGNLSKTEAFRIAGELINNYDNVQIKKHLKNRTLSGYLK